MSSTLSIYRKLQKKGIKFVDYAILGKITNFNSKNSLYKLAHRMKEKNLLLPLTDGGKFILADTNPTEFEIANFMYKPSYISLEAGLSFYGILPQFTYSITSITTSKTKNIKFSGKEYQYSKVKKELYWGYLKLKDDNFLIGRPEKVLLDSLYFHSKGLVKLNFADLDLSEIDNKTLNEFLNKFQDKTVNKLVKELKL